MSRSNFNSNCKAEPLLFQQKSFHLHTWYM